MLDIYFRKLILNKKPSELLLNSPFSEFLFTGIKPKLVSLRWGLEENPDLLATLHALFKEPGILAELHRNSDLVFMSSLLSEGV